MGLRRITGSNGGFWYCGSYSRSYPYQFRVQACLYISLPIKDSTVNYTISWLTHAGVLLFVGTFIGGLIQGAKAKELFTVLWNTAQQLKKTFVTVICLVGLSTIMDMAGMISVIATALATATGSFYPLFAPVIGCLGTFITGSDTSSNILFGKLQASVAGQIHIDPNWLSAANTVGATGGKVLQSLPLQETNREKKARY